MSREIEITYGALSMGGASTSYLIDGKLSVVEQPVNRSASWRVVVVGTSESDFIDKCNALEAEFRKRYLTLTITLGAETDIATGFNTEPSARRVPDVASTGRSRVYECSVAWMVDADDNSSRISSSIELGEDDSLIRTLRVSTRYTLGRDSAISAVRSRANSIISGLSGTWDEVVVTASGDDVDNVTNATAVSREIIYKQSTAGLDHPSITRAIVSYQRTQPDGAKTPGKNARPRSLIRATYGCSVSQNATTDLDALYEDVIRPYLISEVQRIYAPAKTAALVSEDPNIDASNNRITAQLAFEAEIEGGGTYAYTATQSTNTDRGRVVVPVHSGVPTDAHVYQGHRQSIRTTVIRIEGSDESLARLAPVPGHGDITDSPKEDGPPDISDDGGEEGWVLLSEGDELQPSKIGEPDSEMVVNTATYRLTQRYVTKPDEPSGGGPVITPSGAA